MATLYRYLDLDRAKVDKEKRTIPFALSSEFPFDRYERGGVHYREILDHAPGSVDMTRMRKGTGFFWHHDVNKPIGVIESVTLDNDRVMRGVVRFGKSAFAEEKFQDVLDDISTQVSIGYDHVKPLARSKDPKDNVEVIRFAWAPHEASLEPIAVDPTVGKGRSLDPADENHTQDPMKRSILFDATPADGNGKGTLDRSAIESATLGTERARWKEINDAVEIMSKEHPHGEKKFREMGAKAIHEGVLPAVLFPDMLRAIPGLKKADITDANIGMSERDIKRYSLARAIQCVVREKPLDGLELEVSEAFSKRSGQSPEGFWVPPDVMVGVRGRDMGYTRDLNVTTASQGGNLVATILQTPIIEILRNRMVAQRLGVQTLSGLQGNIAIPRQTGAATAYSLAEAAALTKSTQAINQLSLSPHRVGAWNNYTKQVLLQSSIDVENFIRDDLMKVLAIKIDKLILEGSGAGSEPTGIKSTSSIGTVTFGAAATWAKVIAFETALAVGNADMGRMAYVTTPTVRGVWKAAAKIGTTYPVFLWEGPVGVDTSTDGVVNGYRAAVTNQIASDFVAFGNFEEAILGMWGGLDVLVNPYTYSQTGTVEITVNTFIDVAVRHAASFVWSTDSGAQ